MPNLTITAITSSTTKNPKYTTVHSLWQDLQKKQQRNARYSQKLDNFFAEFEQHVVPVERQICEATAALIQHLMSFIERKTIKGAARETLYSWIEQQLEQLDTNPFNPISITELRQQFQDKLAQQQRTLPDLNEQEVILFREFLADMLGQDPGCDTEQLLKLSRDPQKLEAFINAKLAEHRSTQAEFDEFDEFDDDEDMEFNAHGYHQAFSANPRHPSKYQRLSLFEDKNISMLYRRLAKQLHPDKELAPELKQHKKKLMQQLTDAKKQKDPIAMLLLAQAHIPDLELDIDDNWIAALIAALKEKIREVNAEHRQLQHGNELTTYIWNHFGGSKKQRALNLDKYRQALMEDIDTIYAEIAKLSSVTSMNAKLKQRNHSAAMLDFSLMELDEIFGSR
ncbi:MAG: hypothetical protein LPH21_00640 [Shewanella sp.]|nr:hypothetical protein [Shewanella sp.]MCF1430841.1 hypothetical protein [Shewanella sp.]MCF1456117.1 hypothetical protein [Shewanella sp.]